MSKIPIPTGLKSVSASQQPTRYCILILASNVQNSTGSNATSNHINLYLLLDKKGRPLHAFPSSTWKCSRTAAYLVSRLRQGRDPSPWFAFPALYSRQLA
jgi:hypothetical protein